MAEQDLRAVAIEMYDLISRGDVAPLKELPEDESLRFRFEGRKMRSVLASAGARCAGPLIVSSLILLVAACSVTTSLPPSAVTASSVPSVSSEAPIASPPSSPTASPTVSVGTLCAKDFQPCDIPAGTYSSAPFSPAFTFTITAPATNNRAWPHGGDVTGDKGGLFWASGITGAATEKGPVTLGPAPADFIAFLSKPKGWVVSKPVPVTIGGVAGQQVDVATRKLGIRAVFTIPEDAFNVDPGEKIRYLVLAKDGTTVVLMVDAFKEKDFEAVLALEQPILDSITWQ